MENEQRDIDKMRGVINQHSKVIKQLLKKITTLEESILALDRRQSALSSYVKFKLENKQQDRTNDFLKGIFG